ncbi:glycosyltransferase [Anderseniella sp. Alg231-50]|uniref:glycosyltransferase n=1 Tax=Anderseniella sp. Alg231-50 TaxID=1922226 RepID=UPI000D55829E
MLKISHIVTSIESEASGLSYSVPSLAKAQAGLGSDVALLSVGTPGKAHDSGVVFETMPRDLSSIPVLQRLYISSELKKRVAEPGADIIHNHGLWMMPNIYGSLARRKNRDVKLVTAPRGMLSATSLNFSPIRKKVFGHMFQNRALDAVDMFHATAESEADEIRALGYRQPIAVVPNGIHDDVPARSPGRTGRDKVVISIGRVHAKKGLDRLIKSWAEVTKRFPEWRLVIAGPSEKGHSEELTGLVEQLSLTTVEVRGPVFGAEKQRLYADSSLFVLATLNENFGMTVAESLMAGTPVICTKGAPWSGLETQKCGWWIDHGIDRLTAQLCAAMETSEDEIDAMGQRGRAWMKSEFGWETIGRKLIDAYGWLREGGDPPSCVRIT